MLNLNGKVVFITGGGGGIGKAIGLEFAKEGAKIVLADIKQEFLTDAVTSIKNAGAEVIGVTVDVTDYNSVQSAFKKAIDQFGSLDVAVNNAGVVGIGSIEEIDTDEWDRVMNVNSKGVFLCTKVALEIMKPQKSGAIINTSSIAGKMGMAQLSHYVASKFSVIGFSNSIAKEVALDGITVNCVCPGIVGTGMWRGEGGIADRWKLEGETEEQSWERNKKEIIPQGVDQTGEDIASAVVFVAKSPRITGQAIAVDGGITM